MRPAETIATLSSYPNRVAGSDAERRAADGLATVLELELPSGDREVQIEPFWCRPNSALAHAWHAALGIAGSLVTESQPRVGAAMIAIALLSVIADAITGVSLGRRLTPERASQNVVSYAGEGPAVRLLVTANYDAGRAGLVYRDPFRRAAAWLATHTGRIGPGWLGWLGISFVWLLVIATTRLDGHKSTTIGIAQLVPTVGLVLGFALLIELATSRASPGANDNASGVAAAIALGRTLDAARPRWLGVDLLLQGAGDGGAIGLRQYLKARRKRINASNVVVLGFAACGAGTVRWWHTDGSLIPLAYFKQLRKLCAGIAAEVPELSSGPYRGRGTTPALPARVRRFPAITLGCLDDLGVAPRSHQAGDTPDAIDELSVDDAVEFGLLLADAVDALVGERTAREAPAPAPA